MFLISPMENFVVYDLFQLSLEFNNVLFFLFLSSLFFLFLNYPVITHLDFLIPQGYILILSESFYRTILSKIERFLGLKAILFLPLLYTIFHIILFCNLISLIPYTATITVELIFTLTLAFILLIGFLFLGFLTHNYYLFSIFLPGGTPIFLIFLIVPLEIFAYIFRTISLGLRLSINLMTGKILAKVIVSFIWKAFCSGVSILILSIPMLILTLFLCLEIAISYLQSFIFLFITILTISDLQILD